MFVGEDSEVILNRFNKLMQELIRGNLTRNTFQAWELREVVRRETLRRYQKAVQRAMEKGAPRPFPLSEYLSNKKSAASTEPEADDDPAAKRTA
jgi:hypothetical protein